MANEFDQFDSSNAFDQFDQPTPTASQSTPISPVDGQSFGQNAIQGVGKFYTDAMLGARQMYAQAVDAMTLSGPRTVSDLVAGNQPSYSRAAQLQPEVIEKRQIDAPLQATVGGKVGEMAGALPLAFLPGANTYGGSALLGGALGALQPTVGNESRLLNAGLGTGLGIVGKYGGDKLGSWITRRAAEPFMGWNPATANQAAAEAVGESGSLAPALGKQSPVAAAYSRTGDIFNQVRTPDVSANLGNDTLGAIDAAGKSLNRSTRAAFEGNDNVSDLLELAANGGSQNGEQLGSLSSKLGQDAQAQMASKDGDRALGRALFAMKEHVDDVLGTTITDPALAASYSTARQQYRSLSQITANPSIFNSASGDVNMTALGKYLQRTDKPGYLRGGNQSDLYNAARWGQATGEGKGAPPLELGNFGLPWLKYQALNNPLSRAAGGAVSRSLSPVNSAVSPVSTGLAFGTVPVSLPYLEE